MKLLNYILTVLILTSCTKEQENKTPYYSFDNKAKEWLSKININDTLNFVGTNGTIRSYKVFAVDKTRQQVRDCGWTTGNCTIYFDFDQLEIWYKRIDSIPAQPNNAITFSIKLYMWVPDNVDYKQKPLNVVPVARMSGHFEGYNRLPIPPATSSYLKFPDLYSMITTATYTNSVRTYTEVISLKSENSTAYSYSNYISTINEVGFDKKYGFVYFKDIFGNIWNRTN